MDPTQAEACVPPCLHQLLEQRRQRQRLLVAQALPAEAPALACGLRSRADLQVALAGSFCQLKGPAGCGTQALKGCRQRPWGVETISIAPLHVADRSGVPVSWPEPVQ